MHRYKDLKLWQKGIDLVVKIHEITKNFPKEEIYGLTSQMRRSSVSIPSNIAEGSGRNTQKDFAHFIAISLGSSAELETQLIISEKLNFIDNQVLKELTKDIEEIQNMAYKFKEKLLNNQK